MTSHPLDNRIEELYDLALCTGETISKVLKK